ncbi:MAG: hypothetical protein PUB34_00830 [Clostridia bacterium]|nr:hypothetical protein [Clostridia bacterium]
MVWQDRKDARVCHVPEILEFSPASCTKGESVVLTVDEFEAIAERMQRTARGRENNRTNI